MTTLCRSRRPLGLLPEFTLHVNGRNVEPVVRVIGDADLYTAPLLEQQLRELIDEGARAITVDIADLTFIDAAGITALVRTGNDLRRSGGRMRLRSPSRNVQKVLRITGVGSLLSDDLTAVGMDGLSRR